MIDYSNVSAVCFYISEVIAEGVNRLVESEVKNGER